MAKNILNWIKNHEKELFLILGLILISIFSFEIGIIRGQKNVSKPIIIERPTEGQKMPQEREITSKPTMNDNKAETLENTQNKAPSNQKECQFVGSKNSNKYHVPSCQWAKRIKPENLVCFSSKEDAASKGYTADKCIK